MGSGWFIPDAAYFWRKNIGLKLIEKHTKLASICMVGLRAAIILHHLILFAITRRAIWTSLPGGSWLVEFFDKWLGYWTGKLFGNGAIKERLSWLLP